MAGKDINLVSIDNADLKTSLIGFLKTTDEFKDFNYEGSAINTLIDMLVFNTTYYTFFANMVANESSIQHAQKRNNVVLHADSIGYTPNSKTTSRLVADVIVKGYTNSKLNNDSMLTMPKGVQFMCVYEDTTYTFTNIKEYNAYYNYENNNYTFKNVTLYQGTYVTNTLNYTGSFVLVNSNIDTETISISEKISQKPYYRLYSKCDDISLINNDSNSFYVKEDENLTYEIGFGKNIIGREPAASAELTVSYMVCDDVVGNGVNSLIAAQMIDGLADITVNVTTPAWGGSDREDIETIRSLAPRYHQSQNRGVTYGDYAVLVKNQFPVVSDVAVWGGEDANPPSYGNVFISLVMAGNPLGYIGVKDKIITYLDKRKVGNVTPVIVEPDEFKLSLEIDVSCETNLKDEILAVVNSYGKTLGKFNQSFNQSLLNYHIMAIDGVESIEKFRKTINSSHTLVTQGFWYNYNNVIKPNTYILSDKNGVVAADDGSGNVVIVDTGEVIGTLDYKKGTLNLSKWDYTSSPSVQFEVSGKHFNVEKNIICNLASIDIVFI